MAILNIESIARSITSKTKMIILNSPHNPMGSVISKEEYQAIARIVKNKDIIVVSDEVYEHIYAGKNYISALQIEELAPQLIVLQSLGKTYNITGWRLGVCITNKNMISAMSAVKQNTSFSAPHPLQLALADGIVNHPEYCDNLPSLYQKQHKIILDNLTSKTFKIKDWNGSPFLILEYNADKHPCDYQFAERIIKQNGVGLIPISSLYKNKKQGMLRLCFAKKDKTLIKGCQALCQV